MPERLTENPRETLVSITLNRASLGEAPHVFARIQAPPGYGAHIAYVPREDVTIDEQLLTGDEISAKLRVRVLEENEKGFLVETQDGKRTVRWSVDKEGRIIPVSLEPVFNH